MGRRMKHLFQSSLRLIRGWYSFAKPWRRRRQAATRKKIIGREEHGHDDDDDDKSVAVAAAAAAAASLVVPSISPNNWDKLPHDILGRICERLDLIDRIRINVVCKGWTSSSKITATPPSLWLMLPYINKDQYLTFFDMCEGKHHKSKLPESVQGGWFCGASNGWLFHADANDRWQTSLFDPISRQHIPLPSLSTLIISKIFSTNYCKLITMITCSRRCHPVSLIVDKVTVSSSDASQCVVAILLSAPNEAKLLALCRPRHDERWTIVQGPDEEEGSEYEDILFSQDGKKLYVCTISSADRDNNNNNNNNNNNDNGGPIPIQARSLTLAAAKGDDHNNDQDLNLNLILIPYIRPTLHSEVFRMDDDEDYMWYSKDHWSSPILVELNGQLLLVNQIGDMIFTPGDKLEYFRTTRFEVLKIQMMIGAAAAYFLRANDLDNQSLFIGNGVGIAGRHFDFDLGDDDDKNCIYFLERLHLIGRKHLNFRDSGVFHLEDGRIKRSLPSFKTERLNDRTWLSPNIKVGFFY